MSSKRWAPYSRVRILARLFVKRPAVESGAMNPKTTALCIVFGIAAGTSLAVCCDDAAPIAAPNTPCDGESQTVNASLKWVTDGPLIPPPVFDDIDVVAVKDPSIVYFDGKWRLFCTLRGKKRSHAIACTSFVNWKDAPKAKWSLLSNHPGYYCAPQVFYFTPQKKWYMICQASQEDWTPQYQASYSVNDDIRDVKGWTRVQPLGLSQTSDRKSGLDFWVICDKEFAHLFFTTLDGKMRRAQTKIADFPHGWSEPKTVLKGDIFEASHTYYVADENKYVTLIEAQHGHGWRYFKLYEAASLDGEWKPVWASKEDALASMKNVLQSNERWTDNISHGEFLRSGYDERLEIAPDQWKIVFQGVLDKDRKGKGYGEIPWRLGVLETH